jgi:hypothetical protein
MMQSKARRKKIYRITARELWRHDVCMAWDCGVFVIIDQKHEYSSTNVVDIKYLGAIAAREYFISDTHPKREL